MQLLSSMTGRSSENGEGSTALQACFDPFSKAMQETVRMAHARQACVNSSKQFLSFHVD